MVQSWVQNVSWQSAAALYTGKTGGFDCVFLSNGNTNPNEVSYSGTRMRLREMVLSHDQDLKSNKSPQNWLFL